MSDQTRSVLLSAGNGTAIGDPLEALDQDAGDTRHFRLVAGASSFSIDAATGQLRLSENYTGTELETGQEYILQVKVVDSTAFSLCMDNRMDMRVFGMEPAGNVTRALLGETIGTLVTA